MSKKTPSMANRMLRFGAVGAMKQPAEELDRAEIGGAVPKVVGSPSIDKPDYWWFVVRGRLLEKLMGKYVTKEDRILDIGSADGPSAEWLNDRGWKVSSDIDPRGLKPEDNGIVSNALAMPFRGESFTVVSAFDVIEHIDPEQGALDEFYRVLQPGGLVLISVPAYQWAWTSFDVFNCHHRRYTKKRLREAMERSGFEVERLTYGFFGTFPFFAADRLKTRFLERGKKFDARGEGVLPPLPEISPLVEKILFAFSKLDEFLINRVSLPFGSSVMVVARKKG